MAAPSSIVAALARMLHLLADAPDDRDAQKAEFRSLFASLEATGATRPDEKVQKASKKGAKKAAKKEA